MLRIGAVSYLNTKPLIYGLRDRLKGLATLSLNLPSRLADQLRRGELDIALIPSIEYLRGSSHYQIVSDSVIACRGPVWSVRLLSRVPVRQIRTLALDEGSRTSAAMVRILLAERYALHPRSVPLAMEQTPEAVDADAILMIGDRAMHPPRGVYREIWDLGDQWVRHTGRPFVFAPWVSRHREIDPLVVEALQTSRDEGQRNLRQIASDHAAGHGLSIDDLHDYFANNLHFKMGDSERAGLELLRSKAAAQNLLVDQHDSSTDPVLPL